MEVALIAVLGPTGCGKTSFVNEASGSTFKIGASLRSCTDAVQPSKPFDLCSDKLPGGAKVVLIDTPGFDDTTRSDLDVLRMIAGHLKNCYAKKPKKKLSGVIYMQRVSDPRMGGTYVLNARVFRKLCGRLSMPNVIIATTFWDKVSKDTGLARSKELENELFFGPALKRGATMMAHDGGRTTALDIVSTILRLENERALRIQKELVDKQKELLRTSAAQELHRALREKLRKFEEELDILDKDLGVSGSTTRTQANKQGLNFDTADDKALQRTIATLREDASTIQSANSWLQLLRWKTNSR